MSKKIIVFIGELNSEISFFQEFVKKHYKIKNENIKPGIVYKKKENFIIFAHPIIGIKEHRGGDKTFSSPKTYIDIDKKIFSSKHNFPNLSEYEFIYFYLTDKDNDNSEQKLNGVEELINKHCASYTGKIEKIFAVKEIETWFLAGLGKKFIESYPEINVIELDNFYKNSDIENIDDTKEFLKDIILKETKIGTSQGYIGREFGKYIDILQAKNKSKSFKYFIETMDNLLN